MVTGSRETFNSFALAFFLLLELHQNNFIFRVSNYIFCRRFHCSVFVLLMCYMQGYVNSHQFCCQHFSHVFSFILIMIKGIFFPPVVLLFLLRTLLIRESLNCNANNGNCYLNFFARQRCATVYAVLALLLKHAFTT